MSAVNSLSKSSSWPLNAIVYQIYPRSFQDSNNDGIGDINGIIKRLDYLHVLGINTIWLSPIYPSPMVDFGYDVSDYCDIDPVYGNLEEFKKLLEECHKRGINLLMDFIPNHTSTKHKWFLESKKSKKNPKRDYYIWKDPHPGNGDVPNNWLSNFGGSAWEFDDETGQYYMHSFDKEQADLNWRNPEVVREMLNVLRFWLDLGVDGFRVDVPEWMIKDDRFLDEPENPLYATGSVMDPYQKLIHTYTFAQKEYLDIIRQFIGVLEEYDKKFMVTEVWSPSDQLIKVYNEIERDFFAPFNFFIITHPWKAQVHRKMIDNYDSRVTHQYTPTYVLGNHDKPRVASRIGSDQLRVAAMLLFTLRGIPFIYYGEEIGMEDTDIPKDKIQDPFEKNVPGMGLGRDPQRTPMQWNNQKNGGFSDHEPWLPVNGKYKEVNIEKQIEEKDSLYDLYKELIAVRNNSQALLNGKYSSWETGVEDVFAYTRHSGTEVVLVILNYSDKDQIVTLPFRKGTLILDTHKRLKKGTDILLLDLDLPANNGYLISI
jgi:alpha-glucosidase